MIEFDESEYLESDLTDDALRIVLLICGQDVKDSLLYPRKEAAAAHGRPNRAYP